MRGRRKKQLLREQPWLRHQTLVVEDLRGGRFEPEPEKSGICFDGVVVDTVDFSGMELQAFSATGCEFRSCDFRGAQLKENVTMSYSPQSVYRDCCFDTADMVGPRVGMFSLGVARFEHCSFRRTRISSWFSFSAEFVGCVFEGTLKSCTFHGRTPAGIGGGHLTPRSDRNEFRDNDFTTTDLVGCAFAGGIDMRAQRWPQDDDYVWIDDVPAAVERADAAIASWSLEPEQERAARATVSVLDLDQPQTFVRRSELSRHLESPTADRLLAALSER